MYRTKSGACRLQVVCTPAEYRALQRLAHERGYSVSFIAREYLASCLGWPSEIKTPAGKYQPRGFSRRKRA